MRAKGHKGNVALVTIAILWRRARGGRHTGAMMGEWHDLFLSKEDGAAADMRLLADSKMVFKQDLTA